MNTRFCSPIACELSWSFVVRYLTCAVYTLRTAIPTRSLQDYLPRYAGIHAKGVIGMMERAE